MHTCIIIDDEEKSTNTLSSAITNYLGEKLSIVAIAHSADEGFKLINKFQPQILFLDIEMPHGSGFDLLERFDSPNFEVIFTTGFADHAITAIRFSALDFLLKPIDISELKESVDRAIKSISQNDNNNNRLKMLLENLKSPIDKNNKIPLPVLNGLQMVKVSDIVYCKADEDYTHVFLNTEKSNKLVVTKSIKDFEDLLSSYGFFRLHHSYLINKQYIQKYIKGEGGSIITDFGDEIPVSRRRKVDFLEWLKEN